MATQTKPYDRDTRPEYRSVTFTDSDFSVNDVLDIQGSIGRSGIKIEVESGSTASVTYRLNAVRTIYGLEPNSKSHGFDRPDFTNSGEVIDTTINTRTVENGETYSENIVVKNIQITALTAGNGITIKVR